MQTNKTKTEFLRILKYTFFAASAGIIQFTSFALLNELLHLDYWVSYVISLVLSVLWNFTFNRKYTFRTVAVVWFAMLQVFGFYLIFTPASILWGNALANAHWNEYIILIITMLANLVLEYLFYKFVVYRNNIDTAKPKQQINQTNTENN